MDEELSLVKLVKWGLWSENVTEDRWTKRDFSCKFTFETTEKEYMMISTENNRGIPDGEKGEDKTVKVEE